jgi:hypothetical protein
MKITSAYICNSCEEILSGAPHGKCSACSSDSLYPLGWLTRPEEERTRWFNLIRGKVRGSRTANIRALRRAA